MECQAATVSETRRVLILEADEVLTDMMLELLGRDGCNVTAVKNLDEAVSHLCGTEPKVDMVIFDADTVSLNTASDTLIRWQAWLGECRHPLPCVVVSVQAASARRLRSLLTSPGRDEHANGPIWLRKPFRNEEFLSAVRHTPGGNQAASEALGTMRL